MGVTFVGTLVAERWPHLSPHFVSNLFWLGKLDRQRCPVIAGRRVIPTDYVPEIEATLRQLGKLEGAAHA